MKVLKFFICLLIIILGLVSVTYSQTFYVEPTAVPDSLRSLSMGGAYIAVADDKNVLFHNPAGLSFFGFSLPILNIGASAGDFNSPIVQDMLNGELDKYTEINADDLSSLGAIMSDILKTRLGIGVMPSINLGFMMKHFGIRLYDYVNIDMAVKKMGFLVESDMLIYADVGAIVGGSYVFGKFFSVGINLKYIARAKVSETNLGVSQLLSLFNSLSPEELTSGGYLKLGWGIGSDLGFMAKLGFVGLQNVTVGLTITDWLGGTKINYSSPTDLSAVQNYIMPFSESDEELSDTISPAINIGASIKMEKIPYVPEFLIKDLIGAIDIRNLIIFDFDVDRGYNLFKNIYFGGEAKFFNIDAFSNWFLLPIRMGFGFYQGNMTFGFNFPILHIIHFGFAIWSYERGYYIGESRVTKLGFTVDLSLEF